MPIKRKTEAAPKKRATPSPRRKRAAEVADEQPMMQAASAPAYHEPVISQDEKRRLIIAHAAMRPTRDPVQFMSMWAGVLVAVLAVATGWWWSVGSTLASNTHLSDSIAKLQDIGKRTGPKTQVEIDLEQTSDRLRAMREQAEAQQKLLQQLQQIDPEHRRSAAFLPSAEPATGATSTSSTNP